MTQQQVFRETLEGWPSEALQRLVDKPVGEFVLFHSDKCLVGVADGRGRIQSLHDDYGSELPNWHRIYETDTHADLQMELEASGHGGSVVTWVQQECREILTARRVAAVEADLAVASVPAAGRVEWQDAPTIEQEVVTC